MADELNVPTHRWYEPRNNISLPKTDFSAQTIYASGIQKIDAWINSQPWGNPVPGLFALAEPGVWYDPSDLTTMFQDAAGTTPVTAADQPVGLVLDKSQGLALGPELVTNGDFSAGSTGWTVPAGWSISGGVAVATAASGSLRGGGVTPILGRGYRVEFDVVSYTSGNLYITVGGNFTGQVLLTGSGMSPGRKSIFVLSGSDAARGVEFYGGTVSATIDNISVKELPGNHATQATAASRPTYGVVPATGRRNLLTYTDPDASLPTGWAAFNAQGTNSRTLVSAFGEVATRYPSHNAIRFQTTTGRAGIGQVISVTSGVLYTLSCYIAPGGVSTGSGSEIVLWAYGASTGVNVTKTISNADANGRLTLSFTPSANGTVYVIYGAGAAAAVTADVTMTAPQLELGSTATAYQRVGSAFDVTEAGVQSLSYLSFDGVDDFLVTPTITPGTDKAQVFAGVRKLSDAARAMLAEFGNGGGNGVWAVEAPNSGLGNFGGYSRGTNSAFYGSPNGGILAPATRVLCALGDIANDTALLRINGTQAAQSTTDQGTGNYLANALYIGRRAGTTLPFNGQTYSLVVRFGANLDANTITNTETWVNSKTGAY